MNQRPAGAGGVAKSDKRPSYRRAWLLTIAASVLLLIAIVVAATVDGLQIATEQRTLTALEASLPVRDEVYPGSVTTSPTIVAPSPTPLPPDPLDSALVSPTEIAVPQLEGEGIAATVRIQETDRSLRSGPGSQYASRRPLYPGEQVKLLTVPIKVNGEMWQLVQTDDGRIGWCKADWLLPTETGE
jgi:hypothetical protein